ncbi:competence protein ComK [Pseudogracilibacillus sp. ICA-222130]|uniref:competence protein ComK n=1 Tax=Pseudogracilibacillus sp. ICA-222130 TaxID=3134655 RepID=UPI0030BFF3F1
MFLISNKTKVIERIKEGQFHSRIIESDQVYYSIHSLEALLNNACLKLGTSLEGRIDFTKEILKSNNKIPIPIDPDQCVFMFPTRSVKSPLLSYISYYQVADFEPYEKNVKVIFKDDTTYIAPMTMKQFDIQLKRTSQLIAHFYYKMTI